MTFDQSDQREPERHGELAEKIVAMPLTEGDLIEPIQIGSLLGKETKKQLVDFLRCNADVFTWLAIDMPEISLEVITYKLNMDLGFKPIRQKKRNITPE